MKIIFDGNKIKSISKLIFYIFILLFYYNKNYSYKLFFSLTNYKNKHFMREFRIYYKNFF